MESSFQFCLAYGCPTFETFGCGALLSFLSFHVCRFLQTDFYFRKKVYVFHIFWLSTSIHRRGAVFYYSRIRKGTEMTPQPSVGLDSQYRVITVLGMGQKELLSLKYSVAF
jgi:hypothetical protein